MLSQESKPTPLGPKNPNFTPPEVRKKSQTGSGCRTSEGSKKRIVEKKINTIDILDDWDPKHGSSGFASDIQFIHRSLMDLATGIEKIGTVNNKLNVMSDQQKTLADQQFAFNDKLKTVGDQQVAFNDKLRDVIEQQVAFNDKLRDVIEQQFDIIDKLMAMDKRLLGIRNCQERIEKTITDTVSNQLETVCDRLTVVENRIGGLEESQTTLGGNMTTTQDTLSAEYIRINTNIRRMEESLKKDIEDAKIKSSEDNDEFTPFLQSVTDIDKLQKMEERLKKEIEDAVVELSTTFETEAEVCRNIYITEMMNQIIAIKGKGSSVRYVGKREDHSNSLSRLSSILPSFGEESSIKKPPGVTVTPKENV
uniref:Uncharacterized protein n=1 Tax=Marseillevirus LCMAC101 TaxID=2506602 RepID=A0A481YSA9_9VIRU|nr:MAG: hypothetical protein LCMAC101_04350 [Marseillevirus LCMAC101]